MKRFLTIIAGLLGALCIVALQLAWSVRSTSNLQRITQKANTAQALAAALPEYAASKLPDPEAAKKAFTDEVTTADTELVITSLNESITAAYVGKTDTVEVDLGPIVRPVMSSGYQIPPGTVFADESVQIGGLASVLRIANRALLPLLLCFAGFVALVILLGVKRGFVRSIRSILLFTALFLLGFFLATLTIPILVNTLVSSSGLDAGLRKLVVDYITVASREAGRYYAIWAVGILIIAGIVSAISGVHRAPKRKHHEKSRPQKKKDSGEPREDW
jgi:hypothetical protein